MKVEIKINNENKVLNDAETMNMSVTQWINYLIEISRAIPNQKIVVHQPVNRDRENNGGWVHKWRRR